MRDFKNIDRLYQENLKDFEVFPPNKSWDAIEKRLVTTSKKRRYPIWIRISSIAALFLLLFSVGTIYFIPKDNITEESIPIQIDQEEIIDNKDNSNVITSVNNSSSIDKKTVRNKKLDLDQEENIPNFNYQTEEIISDNSEETTFNKRVLNKYLLTDTSNLPLQKEKKNEVSKKEVTRNKFTVATIFAPIYFNSFGDGSGVDAQFRNNPVSGGSSYSYGVKFAYQLNNRFSLQSGINLINLGYKTNNVYVTPGVAIIGFSNLSTSPILARSGNTSKTNDEVSGSADSNKGSLSQHFGYIEIPVEIKYNVANGKIGVNIVGGFSTLLLNSDEVFIEIDNLSQSLGSSNNLRSINFSGNIGIDVDYSIRKNLFINVSPMFKIHTNTFSKNSGSLQPYYIGVYTGLNYKF